LFNMEGRSSFLSQHFFCFSTIGRRVKKEIIMKVHHLKNRGWRDGRSRGDPPDEIRAPQGFRLLGRDSIVRSRVLPMSWDFNWHYLGIFIYFPAIPSGLNYYCEYLAQEPKAQRSHAQKEPMANFLTWLSSRTEGDIL
jgi:hypothetical protein